MNKNVIYTAIYGNKDVLRNPLVVDKDYDYVCFTDDKNLKSDVWNCTYSPAIHDDPVRSAKVFKAKPHEYFKEYDISLWIDANFLIKSNVHSFLDKTNNLKETNMLLFQHDQGRDCTANSILLRRHNSDDIVKLSDMWWEEISNFSRRDQLSFCYCLWKLSMKYYLLKYPNVNIRNNEWFHWLPHNFELQEWK